MSRGDFLQNEFMTLDQYRELQTNYNFNLFTNLFPRDLNAIKLQEHVNYLKANTDLFDTFDEEYYFRTIESFTCLGEKYTNILVSESPYDSNILKRLEINGKDFINFLRISSSSNSNIFFPMPKSDGGKYPLPREDLLIDRYSIGYTEFLYETIDEHEFIIFKVDNMFV